MNLFTQMLYILSFVLTNLRDIISVCEITQDRRPTSSKKLFRPAGFASTWSACPVWKSVCLSCYRLCYHWFPVSSNVLICFINVTVKLVIKTFYLMTIKIFMHFICTWMKKNISQSRCKCWDFMVSKH